MLRSEAEEAEKRGEVSDYEYDFDPSDGAACLEALKHIGFNAHDIAERIARGKA